MATNHWVQTLQTEVGERQARSGLCGGGEGPRCHGALGRVEVGVPGCPMRLCSLQGQVLQDHHIRAVQGGAGGARQEEIQRQERGGGRQGGAQTRRGQGPHHRGSDGECGGGQDGGPHVGRPCLWSGPRADLPHAPALLQKAISSPTVSRLTDTTKFTGSHKERFDPSGRGKGRAGRVDLVDESGYVPGYKHAGTYDQKVQGGK